MVDSDVIQRRLTALEEYISDLEKARKDKCLEEFTTDKIFRRYVERTLHMAIEACLDIANYIISYEGYREPQNNKDCFEVLNEQNIISDQLNTQLKKMAQFRNIIVHDYLKIQPEIVYAILKKNIPDIINFAKLIKDNYL